MVESVGTDVRAAEPGHRGPRRQPRGPGFYSHDNGFIHSFSLVCVCARIFLSFNSVNSYRASSMQRKKPQYYLLRTCS